MRNTHARLVIGAAVLIGIGTLAALGSLMVFLIQKPAPSTPPVVQEYFTQRGEHPDTVLANGIGSANSRVDAALYAVNRASIVDALASKHQACGCVRLISDATQSGGAEQKAAITRLYQAGVPVKIDHHSGIMHLKLVIVDQQTVYEGSFNATNAASTINDEVLFRIDNPEIATAASAEFETMWADSRRFADWTPAAIPTPKAFVP
jgi:phosphatidylserine/phosphatidylglycerophosphate/cardiolipin synthase-like enzyme